ncbi:Multidrug resistance protein MdtA precursor [Vibrio aerogenes CECT 7868]|uniref:Multidrug resistance protein MdtA n=1 Tax=Vibrio aerogenes CECT 7868 TaxID=1216006 RepID=A0A1M5ZU85_9VIBR|nr:efflux RND transporter periplasmic adaptor subunit [Vibrio aerogenes]SHI27821.1 Multidrug resistance protein MdtA precursor [Vibrio aerogenes CECT 7868]
MSKVSVWIVIGLNGLLCTPVFAQESYTVSETTIPVVVTFDGVVEPVNQGTVAAQTSGRVVGVYAGVNDYVKAGSVLLEISATQQTAAFDAANAQLSQAVAQNREAQAQLQRYQRLSDQGVVTQDQLDSADARARSSAALVKSAQAAVTKAKDALGYTRIRAPYDGIVTARHVELGETVSPGTLLFSGYGLDSLRVKAGIPQRYRTRVKMLNQFRVETPDGILRQPASFSLFRYLDPQTHTSTVRLYLSDTDSRELTPGMWVKIRFESGKKTVITVPQQAIFFRGELSAVYRKTVEGLMLTPVRLGPVSGHQVEVLAGLEVGDQVSLNTSLFKGE